MVNGTWYAKLGFSTNLAVINKKMNRIYIDRTKLNSRMGKNRALALWIRQWDSNPTIWCKRTNISQSENCCPWQNFGCLGESTIGHTSIKNFTKKMNDCNKFGASDFWRNFPFFSKILSISVLVCTTINRAPKLLLSSNFRERLAWHLNRERFITTEAASSVRGKWPLCLVVFMITLLQDLVLTPEYVHFADCYGFHLEPAKLLILGMSPVLAT